MAHSSKVLDGESDRGWTLPTAFYSIRTLVGSGAGILTLRLETSSVQLKQNYQRLTLIQGQLMNGVGTVSSLVNTTIDAGEAGDVPTSFMNWP